MNRLITILIIFIATQMGMAQNSYTISPDGFSFSPPELLVNVGDTIFFDGSSTHPVQEVSENTWNSNENTALSGGFAFPSGIGSFVIEKEKTYYYVCTNHVASSGMKGIITASPATSISNKKTLSMQVYPIPVGKGQTINIEINEESWKNVDIIVYNTIGVRLIEKENINTSKITISSNQLKTGMYLLQIECNGESIIQRFTVE